MFAARLSAAVASGFASGLRTMSSAVPVETFNPSGALRVVVTKSLPGDRWLKVLTAAGCRVDVCTDADTILSNDKIKKLMGDKCDGVIGQLTEVRRAGAAAAAKPQAYYAAALARPGQRVQEPVATTRVEVEPGPSTGPLCPASCRTLAATPAGLGRRAVRCAQGCWGACLQQLCCRVQQCGGA